MKDKQQPDALQLADDLESEFAQGRISNHTGRKAATELRRLHAENETMRTGYAAARLEIESLRKERADELAVAYMCGASREQELAAPQPGAAYAELPESLILAVDRWFADNTGLGGCGDEDVRELAALFYGVTHKGGRETVDDALEIVESFGPGIGGLNDTYARQILLADEVKRLRASHGQAPAGESLRTDALCDLSYSHGLKAGWNYCASDDLAGFERAQKIGAEALRTLKSPTAQAAPAAVAGPINRIPLVDRNDPTAELLRDKHNWWELYRNGDPVRSLSRFECEFVNAALAAAPTTQPEPQSSPAAQGDALDAARLDWLEADEGRRVFHLGESWYTRSDYGMPYRKRTSLRAAIDAARATHEGK